MKRAIYVLAVLMVLLAASSAYAVSYGGFDITVTHTAPGWQGRIKSAPDGTGGIFFALSDAANGKQELQNVIDCAAGFAIVCWQDSRTDVYRDVYAQKIGAPTVEDVPSLTDAKSKADGTRIRVQSKVVTSVQSAWFYIEESDRTSGIRVEGTGVSEGQTVSVTGDLATVDGERVITNATIQ